MAGHPQGSNRGLRVWAVVAPTSMTITNSTASVVLGANSTGLTLNSTGGGLKVNSGQANSQIKGNSTGVKIVGALFVSNKGTGKVTSNSTGLILSQNTQMGTLGTKLIDSNSTGVRVGGAGKYIKTNSTGN